ncbi:hypothetical protein Tco_0020160 [Tanacetum coccineum]
MSKLLPLQDKEGRLTVPVEFFFNNNLEYLKAGNKERTYSSSITKTPATRMLLLEYLTGDHNVNSFTELRSTRRADQKLYKFKKGDLLDLHLNDIEDMLLLIAQNKIFNLEGGVIMDFVTALKMFTRGIIVKNRVNDVQLVKEPYTPNYDLPGVIYKDKSKKKRAMRVDEIHKFCDGTLQSVYKILHERLLNFKFVYNKDMPLWEWILKDKRRTSIMLNKIDDQLFKRWVLRSLEVLSLDELAYGVLSEGPYQTNLPSPDDIIPYIREDREGQVTRIRHKEEIKVQDYQIPTREIMLTLKPLEEIILENVFCLRGNRDHVLACLCYMLYCVENSEKFNLAYYMAKRMKWVTKQSSCFESYVLYDHVMDPLGAQKKRKTRKDFGMRRGHHSTSSSSAFDQPSSSHLNDDDDGNDKGTSRASTPSPIRYVNSLTNKVPHVFQNPPNIDPYLEPFYTRQTEIINRQVQIRDENHGGLRSIEKGLRNLWRNIKK